MKQDEKVIHAASAVKKSYTAEFYTDVELTCAVAEIKRTLLFLDKCGPEFRLMCNELRHKQHYFESYVAARKNNA